MNTKQGIFVATYIEKFIKSPHLKIYKFLCEKTMTWNLSIYWLNFETHEFALGLFTHNTQIHILQPRTIVAKSFMSYVVGLKDKKFSQQPEVLVKNTPLQLHHFSQSSKEL